jgi:hypothetical protein
VFDDVANEDACKRPSMLLCPALFFVPLHPTRFVQTTLYREVSYYISTMSVCVSCNKPLEVEIDNEEEDDYEQAGSSSGKGPAPEPETVPDDVQLTCGCHFHWYARYS